MDSNLPLQPIQTQPVPQIKKSNGLTVFLVIALILVSTLAGFLAWQNQKLVKSLKEQLQAPTPSPTPTVTSNPTTDWETYTTNGFSFQFPRNWNVYTTSYPDREIYVSQGEYKLNILIYKDMFPQSCHFSDTSPSDSERHSMNYYDSFIEIKHPKFRMRRGSQIESKSEWDVCMLSTINGKYFTGLWEKTGQEDIFDRIIYSTPEINPDKETIAIMDKILGTIELTE